MRTILAACLLCLSVAALAGQPDAYRSAGDAAYKARDYSTAFADFRLAAAQGDARAQEILGGMYDQGRGVPQDYATAAKWFRLAAQQGNLLAQMALAGDYNQGQGVPQDNVKAYKWYALIKSEAGFGSLAYKLADTMMPALAVSMTPTQITQAQQEASAWWAAHKNGNPPASTASSAMSKSTVSVKLIKAKAVPLNAWVKHEIKTSLPSSFDTLPANEQAWIIGKIAGTHRFQSRLEILRKGQEKEKFVSAQINHYSKLEKINYGTGQARQDRNLVAHYSLVGIGDAFDLLAPSIALVDCVRGYEHHFAYLWKQRNQHP